MPEKKKLTPSRLLEPKTADKFYDHADFLIWDSILLTSRAMKNEFPMVNQPASSASDWSSRLRQTRW